jgi:hypothetical protein
MTESPARSAADCAAIGLSMACLVHCLAVPTLLAIAPWLVPPLFDDERFHTLAVATALPLSMLALAGTLRVHPPIVFLAVLGLGTMIVATLTHDEGLEVPLTVAGASLLAFAHLRNWRMRSAAP